MSKLKKLRDKLFEKPTRNDITINEIVRLMTAYGCIVLTGGRHQIRICYKPLGYVIPIPCHEKTVKEAYVIEVKLLIEQIEQRGDFHL